jgi:Ca2+-binding RTX toxin-like protein
MKNVTQKARRLGAFPVAAAAVVAVATAAAYPAQAAAASHRHTQAHLAHHALRVKGTAANNAIALRLAAGNPAVIQVDLGDNGSADSSFRVAAIDKISVEAQAGNDRVRIDDTNGAFTNAIPTRIDGGQGNDTIAGGAGAERLNGGPGNDTIDGNGGNDVSDLGPGADSFVWDPGDGSDTIEGDDGPDTMVFNGAAASEMVALSANGDRLRFFRNPGNVTMDTHGVEQVDFNALGGADFIDVGDLGATDLTSLSLDLAGALGGSTGDGAVDSVLVAGSAGDDATSISGNASGVKVSGLHTSVAIQHHETGDSLSVAGLDGADTIDASNLAATTLGLVLAGNAGNDTLKGGQGVETLKGGDGDDVVDGNGGNDHADLGAGSDTFVWDPGDGSDTIEGGDGRDTMVFNGAAAAETVDLSANGNRLLFFRNPGNITMDTAGVEFVDFNALGGADNVTVENLAGTDVSLVNLDLAGSLGGTTGDGQVDHVVVNGTNGDDTFAVEGGPGEVKVSGQTPTVDLLHAEATDQLDFETFSGIDILATGGLAPGAIQLFFDGILVP